MVFVVINVSMCWVLGVQGPNHIIYISETLKFKPPSKFFGLKDTFSPGHCVPNIDQMH